LTGTASTVTLGDDGSLPLPLPLRRPTGFGVVVVMVGWLDGVLGLGLLKVHADIGEYWIAKNVHVE